jgi:hypothetical protein
VCEAAAAAVTDSHVSTSGPSAAAAVSSANEVTVEHCLSIDNSLCDSKEFAKLHYVEVIINSKPGNNFKLISALDDSGAEIAVAKTETIAGFDNVEHVGQIKLRGIVGEPVTAELVRLYVRLANNDCPVNNSDCCDDCWTAIMCAVCEQANDQLILTADNVEQLLVHSSQCQSRGLAASVGLGHSADAVIVDNALAAAVITDDDANQVDTLLHDSDKNSCSIIDADVINSGDGVNNLINSDAASINDSAAFDVT